MNLSNHDKRLLQMLTEARNIAKKATEVEALTKHIVAIKNTMVYAAMPVSEEAEPEVQEEHKFDTSKTILLKRGESVTLALIP